MRIPSINSIPFEAKTCQSTSAKTKVDNKNNGLIPIVGVGVGIGAIIGGFLIHKNIKLHKVEKTLANNLLVRFPKDVEYRKELLQAVGIPESRWTSIRSIIGGQEYKSIISQFADKPEAYTPGKSLLTQAKDDYELTAVAQRTFRISLHNHTTKSDGKMSVKNLLDQAVTYADNVAEANSHRTNVIAEDSPFIIAITDHDTVEGCKEAVKLISANPEKYKNLRVILGAELSVENRMLGNDLKKPIPIHMVVNCINPYDKLLNKFLDNKKVARKDFTQRFFEDFKNEANEVVGTEVSSRLSLDEAKQSYQVLQDGLNYPWYYLRSYVKTKMYPDDDKNILKVFNEVKSNFEPKMDLQDYCMDMSDAMDVVSKQKYGYMTIAHPALIPIRNCVVNEKDSHKQLSSLISLFKAKGGERALATEIYYPYYGNVAKNKDLLDTISKAVSDNKLIATGGLDAHGKNIFYSDV